MILVRVAPDGVIEVSDDGPGIPEGERERVFEAFFRLKPRERDAGLGLYLVLQIAQRHNGRVSILTSQSGGACFRLAFENRRT